MPEKRKKPKTKAPRTKRATTPKRRRRRTAPVNQNINRININMGEGAGGRGAMPSGYRPSGGTTNSYSFAPPASAPITLYMQQPRAENPQRPVWLNPAGIGAENRATLDTDLTSIYNSIPQAQYSVAPMPATPSVQMPSIYAPAPPSEGIPGVEQMPQRNLADMMSQSNSDNSDDVSQLSEPDEFDQIAVAEDASASNTSASATPAPAPDTPAPATPAPAPAPAKPPNTAVIIKNLQASAVRVGGYRYVVDTNEPGSKKRRTAGQRISDINSTIANNRDKLIQLGYAPDFIDGILDESTLIGYNQAQTTQALKDQAKPA